MIPTGTLIATHDQTNGIGRFDRSWIAPTHQPLFFRLLHHQRTTNRYPRPHHGHRACCPRSPSLAPNQCTTQMAQRPACSRKKICGILSEHRTSYHPQKGIITGVGLNVNLPTARVHYHRSTCHIHAGQKPTQHSLLKPPR